MAITKQLMISLTKAQVPAYLVGSEFYNSLSADDEEEFSIPEECLKPTVNVSTALELKHILSTLRFWGVLRLPFEIMELLILKSRPISDVEYQLMGDTLLGFDREFKLYDLFKTLPMCTDDKQKLNNAQMSGREDVLEYMYLLEGKATVELIKGAAENGHLHLLKRLTVNYLQTNQHPFATVSIATVVRRGFSSCFRFMLADGKDKDVTCIACFAARCGQLSCLQVACEYACAQAQRIDDDELASAAIEGDQVECLQYILDKGVAPTRRMCYSACRHNSLACLKLLRAQGAPWDVVCARKAAERGSVLCLQYLLREGCPGDENSVHNAASNGHVECLRILLEAGCNVNSKSVTIAAAYGHISCLRVLKEYDVQFNEIRWGYNAKLFGDTTFIRALFEAGYTVPYCAMKSAVNHNNIASVEFICANRCCDLNVELTHFENIALAVLKILHHHGCPFDEITANTAARNGAFEILEYVVLQNCPVSIFTMHAAAKSCSLPAIKLLHEHHCPWNEFICYESAVRCDAECLRYCLEHGCPCDAASCLAALGGGFPKILQLLHEHGCPWDVTVSSAAAAWKRPLCLQYCLENDCPRDASTSLAAAQSGYLHGLKLLHEHGCPWDERVSQAAAASDNAFCLRYCVENGCPISKATMALYNRIVKYECL